MKEFKKDYLSTNKHIHTIGHQLLRTRATCNDIFQTDSEPDDVQVDDDPQVLPFQSVSENISPFSNILTSRWSRILHSVTILV